MQHIFLRAQKFYNKLHFINVSEHWRQKAILSQSTVAFAIATPVAVIDGVIVIVVVMIQLYFVFLRWCVVQR